MNEAIVIFDPSQSDEDMMILLSAIKYVTTSLANGKFKNASLMLSQKTDSHIHEFKKVHSPHIVGTHFVKCIHCQQCFPIIPE